MIFTDTITFYHHTDGFWERNVIKGVQWKPKTEKSIDSSGSLKIVDYVSVTIPYTGIDHQFSCDNLDVIVLGESDTELTEDNFHDVAGQGITVKSVADNTYRDNLKHWRVIGS